MRLLKKYFFIFLIFVFSFSYAAEEVEQLKIQDVQKIMKQIFEQHVDKKDISTSVVKNSFKVYIEQFDPQKIYLTDKEIAPFINPSEAQLNVDVDQYKKNIYFTYQALNDVIQRSIVRARAYRQ